jgi:hypothetical protein
MLSPLLIGYELLCQVVGVGALENKV